MSWQPDGDSGLFVLVGGWPGSGKSTLARALAAQLRVPLLAKDEIKESLADALGQPDSVAESQHLGRAAVLVLLNVARRCPSAVMDSTWFEYSRPRVTQLPGALVEVRCVVPREVARARYCARADSRHGGHLDRDRSEDELWGQPSLPLGVGPVLDVDTSGAVDVAALAAQVLWTVAGVAPAGPYRQQMRTVVLGDPPAELAALLDKRRSLGLDRFDELWAGAYHVAPAPRPAHGYVDRALGVLLAPYAAAAGLVGTGPFNLGTASDYRVPDGGYHRALPEQVYADTAAVVVEVVSPDDETYAKFGFYAAHGVEELLTADPASRQVRCWRRAAADRYVETARSDLLDVGAADLTAGISWPPTG